MLEGEDMKKNNYIFGLGTRTNKLEVCLGEVILYCTTVLLLLFLFLNESNNHKK